MCRFGVGRLQDVTGCELEPAGQSFKSFPDNLLTE